MTPTENKILTADAVRELREKHRAAGEVVVQCHGCFDIVHPGHIRYLRFAKEQGDVLIVSLTADAEIQKGYDRPYFGQRLRAESLAALECVDYVCVDSNAWAGPILELLRPDIYVKGKEYETNAHPGFLREKAVVESYGGNIIFSSGDVIYSSTAIINESRSRPDLNHERISSYCEQHAINLSTLETLIEQFKHLRILVLGDPILDHYVHCDAKGVAAENPMLCVAPLSEDWYVGAAGLVARQVAALGANAAFLTILDGSLESTRLARSLEDSHVEVLPITVEQRPTYVKTRYLVDDNKVFKVDTGRYAPLSTVASTEVLQACERNIGYYDAVIVIDFGYGFFTSEIVRALPQLTARHRKPYYVDVSTTQRTNILKFQTPRLATPTEGELRFAFADNESGLSHLACHYYRDTRAERLILTMDKRGILIFAPPQLDTDRLHTDYLPALADRAVDAVGAGDVFHASVTLADLAGESMQMAGYLGSCLAALHVSRLGNDPVSRRDVQTFLARRPELLHV